MADLFLNYLSRSSAITLFVLAWLTIYFIVTIWISIVRYLTLNKSMRTEKDSLESMLMGSYTVRNDSILRRCAGIGNISDKLLDVCRNVAEKNATSSLAMLSVIASTSPFIGLFGTVIAILETFSDLGQSTSASLNVIAPAISEALVATGAGIFVAIPAYSAHILLKRRGYEYISLVDRESDLLLANQAKQKDTDDDEKNEI